MNQQENPTQPMTEEDSDSPRRFTPALTWMLIVANIAMFVLTTCFGGYSTFLFNQMRLVPMTLGVGTLWTLVTSMFLHANFGHLLANMYSLYILGPICEHMLGRRRYLLAYFGGGVAGGLVFALLRHGEVAAAVGASGAIFSLMGVYGAFLMAIRHVAKDAGQGERPDIDMAWRNFVTILLINAIIVPIQGNIAWEGHLGGFLFGFLFGRWYAARLPEANQVATAPGEQPAGETLETHPEASCEEHGANDGHIR